MKNAPADFENGKRSVAEIGFETFADGMAKLATSVGLAKPEEAPVPDGWNPLAV
jgi:hypothetical protein